MKVFSDAARLSPLDTWLHDAEPGNAGAAHEPRAAESSALALPATQIPDAAERLLGFDVWNGAPAASRLLAAAASAPPTTGNAVRPTAQQWADHIFAPLR